MSWIAMGLRGGILTTRYPLRVDAMPEQYRGAIEALDASLEIQRSAATMCLSGAIVPGAPRASVDVERCFQCGECARFAPEAFRSTSEFELATTRGDSETVRERLRQRARAFGRSVHLRHVDAGSDGSEEQEFAAIFNPFYDANRLGIFLTATPRHADLLVVTGVVTKAMSDPLKRTYEAMPEPKTVIALGTSACSGGIFADSPAIVGPVSSVLPVDVLVPGAPPSPLSILHGIWVALGNMRAKGRST